VAKAFSTDIGHPRVASLGIQVHGGMGYIEETGAAQQSARCPHRHHLRRHQRIQAIDLVTRKLPLSDGAAGQSPVSTSLRETIVAVAAVNDPAFRATPPRGWPKRSNALEFAATAWLLGRLEKQPDAALAGATPYLRLFRDRGPAAPCWPTRRSPPSAPRDLIRPAAWRSTRLLCRERGRAGKRAGTHGGRGRRQRGRCGVALA